MTKDVLITISGLQYDIDAGDVIEVVTTGKYYYKNNKHYILYEEYNDNDLSEVTKNTIKISDSQLDILKQGANNVHMVFEKDKDTATFYNTPFGALQIGTSTSKLSINKTDTSLEVQVTYNLSVNYTYVSECSISLKVNSVNAE